MDSVGLSLLVGTSRGLKRGGKRLRVTNACPRILQAISLAGLGEMFGIVGMSPLGMVA